MKLIAQIVTVFAVVFLTGCAVSGHYVSSGPCKGFHKNPEACKRAGENAAAIAHVKIGQTTDEVTKLMPRRGPDRREATADSERWSYLTDYDMEMMTTIFFSSGRVSQLKQTPWGPDEIR